MNKRNHMDKENSWTEKDRFQIIIKNTKEWAGPEAGTECTDDGKIAASERADGWKVKQAQESFPETPERFRQMIKQAVAMELAKREANETDHAGRQREELDKTDHTGYIRVDSQKKRNVTKTEQVHKICGKKKEMYKMLLPMVAAFVLGGAALAAGGTWLYRQMLEMGFSREEAEVLLVTELQQQATEINKAVFPEGAVKEKDWEEPILNIKEAYFDGSSLHFLAEASQEARCYELSLRDHASVNGLDGITALWEMEEGMYLGEITLWEKAYAGEILETDRVEVVMTAMAYPDYEGKIFYAWKDTEVYEEIFGTGAFENEQLGTCYALSWEDATTGYTPYEITVEVPLSVEAKKIIEQYSSQAAEKAFVTAAIAGDEAQEDTLQEMSEPIEETSGQTVAETDTLQETSDTVEAQAISGQNIAGTGTQQETSDTVKVQETSEQVVVETDALEETQEIAGQDEPESGTPQDKMIAGSIYGLWSAAENAQISDTHITCELPGKERNLSIDAEITRMNEECYTGILQVEAVDTAKLEDLYTVGDSQVWQEQITEGPYQWRNGQYGENRISVSSALEIAHYQNDELSSAELTDGLARAEEGMEAEFCKEVLAQLGRESIVTVNEELSTEQYKFLIAQTMLEGLPIAWFSQWNSKSSMTLENGYIASWNMPAEFTVGEKESAKLADMEVILEKTAGYVAAGDISIVEGDMPVDEISLEYYVDVTKEGFVFRPIWNFKVSAGWDGIEGSLSAENYIYLDAVTGALIRDRYGYQNW